MVVDKETAVLSFNEVRLEYEESTVYATIITGGGKGACSIKDFEDVVDVLREKFGANDSMICVLGKEDRLIIQISIPKSND